jgi:hypothetical protein
MSEFRDLQAKSRRQGFPNWFEKINGDLSDEQRDDLVDALKDRDISARVICAVLEGWGFKVSDGQIARYRRLHGF